MMNKAILGQCLFEEIDQLKKENEELKQINEEHRKLNGELRNCIDKAIEYIESYLPNYDFDKTNLKKLLEILRESESE